MTEIDKQRIAEIDAQIEQLMAEKYAINPYSTLKSLSNKAFGEQWSEPYICSKCPNLIRRNGPGHDLWSEKLGRIEVKSSRLPCAKITFNQIHPQDCDYFLFVEYDTINGDQLIYLVPSADLLDTNKFHLSAQHDRNNGSCYSLNGNTARTRNSLLAYQYTSWEDLNDKT